MAALFFLLSLVSYDGAEAEEIFSGSGNLMGVAGQWTAYFVFSLVGVIAYLLSAFVWVGAVTLFIPRPKAFRTKATLGMLLVGVFAAVLIHAALKDSMILGHPAGGALGEILGELSLSIFSTGGTYLVTIGCILITLLVVTDISLITAARTVGFAAVSLAMMGARFSRRVVEAWKIDPDEESEEADDAPEETTQVTRVPAPKRKKRAVAPVSDPAPEPENE